MSSEIAGNVNKRTVRESLGYLSRVYTVFRFVKQYSVLFLCIFLQPAVQITSNLLDKRHKEQWSEIQKVITDKYFITEILSSQ